MITYKVKPLEEYKMLQFRVGEEIPYIKDTDVRADCVYITPFKVLGLSSENISKEKGLPKNGVAEAIKWCKNNEDLVTRVLKKEGKEAGIY